MAQLKSSVKASTLLEVIVAMVIILIVFSLAIGIYNNVLGSGNSAKEEELNSLMEHVISKTITDKNWNGEEFNHGNIKIKKSVTDFEDFSDIILITVTATEQNHELGKMRQLANKTANED